MKLVAVEIDGFGVWKDLRLGEFSDHLNVVYGPNEAGKTTLLQFVRGVLYGFSAPRRARYLPPVQGGQAGGRLVVSDGAVRYTIGRYLDARPDTHREELTLVAEDGSHRPASFLQVLLGGMDEAVFCNVFAVGLRELQELSTLSDTAAAEQLYGLVAGRDRVSLAAVVAKLQEAQRQLLGSDPLSATRLPSDTGLLALAAQRERLAEQMGAESQQASRYAALVVRRDEIAQRIGALQAELDTLRRSVHHLELALKLREPWQKRAELAARLEQIASQPPLPPGTVAQLDALAARSEQCRTRRQQARKRLRQTRRKLARLAPSRAVQRQLPRLEALLDQQSWAASLETRIEELQQARQQLEANLEAERKRLGPGLARDDAASVAAAGRLLGHLRAAAAELREARTAWRAAQERVRAVQAESAHVAAAGASAENTAADRLTAALEQAGNLVQQLRRRLQIDERLDQLRVRRQELQGDHRRLLERELLPGWVLLGWGTLFVCGAALALSGLVLPTSVVGEAGWTLTILGLAAAGLAVGGKVSMERGTRRQRELCHQQLALLEQELAQAEQEAQALDAKLPRSGGSLAVRLEQAERALAELEDQAAADARQRAARQQAELAQQAAESAQAQLKTATRRWKEALAAVGLPDGFEPNRLSDTARSFRRLRDLEAELARQRNEEAACRRELQAFAARLEQTLAEAGLNLPAGPLRERLPALRNVLEAHQQAVVRRRALVRHARLLHRRQQQLSRRLQHLARRRKRLLRAANTATEDELRARASRRAEADAWQAEHDRLGQEIAALLAAQAGEPPAALRQSIESWLTGPDAARLEQQWEEQAERLQQLETEIRSLHESRGQLCQQLAHLAEDESLPRLAVSLGQAEARLAQAVERFQVLSVARRLLVSIRAEFEARHQPQALRAASHYLQQLTGGSYQRVWTPLDEQVLRVDDAAGRSLDPAVLSRGTREQLYLALRLALVRLFAERGPALPLVLDDVLVNFDAQRARAAVQVLREFALEGHQLLVFTCHEHVFKLFKALKVPAWELPSRSGPPRPASRRSATRSTTAATTGSATPQPSRTARLEPQPADAEATDAMTPAAAAATPASAPAASLAPSAHLAETRPASTPAFAAGDLEELNRLLLDAALSELDEAPVPHRQSRGQRAPAVGWARLDSAGLPAASTTGGQARQPVESGGPAPSQRAAGRLRRGPFDGTHWHEVIDADPELRWLYGDRPITQAASAPAHR